MTLRGALAALALTLAAPVARAQTAATTEAAPAAPLTLDAVLRAVDDDFPLLEAARREQEAADGALLSAEGAFDPQVRLRAATVAGGYYEYARGDLTVQQPTRLWGTTFFAGYRLGRGLSSGGIPDYYGFYETNAGGEVRAGVQVPLLRDGPIDARRAGIRRAELGRPIAELGVEMAALQYRRAAADRYWEWVAAGRKLRIARALLDLATARNEGISVRVDRGDLPAIERTDNLRVVAQRRGGAVSAERALQRAAIELSLFLRDARGEAILPSDARLPDDLPDVSPLSPATIADDIRSAPARRPELRRLNAQRAQFEVDRDLARNQMLPAVDVVVSASQDIGSGSSTRSSPEVDASLLLDVPILNRPARGRLEVARANLSRLDEQLRFQRDRILADLRDARSAVDAALQRAELAAQELSVARQVEAAERTNFELGNSTILAVNLREQASAEAASREVDARADFHRAMAAYLAAAARR